MRKKWKPLLSFFAVLFVLFPIGTTVIADDDDDDDHEKQEYYQENHDDDQGGEYEYKSPRSNQAINQQSDYWYIWSREPRNNPNNPLPIETPAELPVTANNTEMKLYLIPQDGQLLVSAESIAGVLGAETKFYPQSKVCIIIKENKELIVRAGSNAAYENQMKTPMPVKAVSLENSVYIPISVAANALGYRVSWGEVNKKLVLQAI